MPDDSLPGQHVAQTRHASQEDFKRTMHDVIGLPPSVVRARLQAFAEREQRRNPQTLEQGQLAKPPVVTPAPVIDNFQPRPFAPIRQVDAGVPGTAGSWYSLTLCDGTTLDVWATNIVPP